MDAIFFFLVVIAVSILVTRTGTSALTLTGLSRESARFQARSAFSGAGFTTNEAEAVVNHPVRRRVVLLLMLLGSAGLVTTIATLVLSFSRIGAAEGLLLPAILAGGVAVLWAVSSSRWVDRWLSHLIELALNRFTELDVRDYWHLLHLSEDWKATPLARPPEPDTRPWWIGRRPRSGRRVRSADLRRPGRHSSAPSISSAPSVGPPAGRRQSSTISVRVFTAPGEGAMTPPVRRTYSRVKAAPKKTMRVE